jgi:hypothetical protein
VEGRHSWGHGIYNAISREFLLVMYSLNVHTLADVKANEVSKIGLSVECEPFSVLGTCGSVPKLSAVGIFRAMWVGQMRYVERVLRCVEANSKCQKAKAYKKSSKLSSRIGEIGRR